MAVMTTPRRGQTSIRGALTRLDAALSRLAGEQDEWTDMRVPVQMLAGTPPGRVIYLTKSTWMEMCDGWGTLDGGRTSLFTRYGIVPGVYADVVRLEMARMRAKKLAVVGDLDPLDLTVLLSLQCGGIEETARPGSIPVRWLGVRDQWLSACDRALGSKGSVWATVTMNAFEVEHWRRLEALGISWEAIIGSRSVALLRAGKKVELEGASNPSIYGRPFLAKVRRLGGLEPRP
jgi:hypothetical protein